MKQLRTPVLLISCFSLLGLFVPAQASALPALPSGAGDITPDINWSQFISPIMNASGITCTVSSVSNFNGVLVGDVLAPISNPLTDGLKLRNIVLDPDSNVGSTCVSEVTIASTPIEVTGTISAPGMATVPGVGTSGNLTLACTVKTSIPTITVSVAANFGGGVSGKARITGESSTGVISFDCNMALAFGSSAGIAGTVTGTLTIGDAAANPSCVGQLSPTCIPVSLNNAVVSVTGGSGALAEAAGSGTYSFNDSFKLPSIDSNLSVVGVSSVRSMSAPTALTANSDELKLNLQAGRHSVKVTGVSNTSFAFMSGAQIQIATSPTSRCKVTASVKNKTVSIASPTVSSFGTARFTISSSAVKKIKSAGAKQNSKVNMTTSCTLGKKTATAKSSPKFSG